MMADWLSSLGASLLLLGLALFIWVIGVNFFEARKLGLPFGGVAGRAPSTETETINESADGQDEPVPPSDTYSAEHSRPLDARYELVVAYSGPSVSRAGISDALSGLTRIQTKPVRAYLEPNAEVVHIGLILATRAGFASIIEIEDFLQTTERLATSLGLSRLGPLPDSATFIGQARRLTDLIEGLDGQVCFHLKASRLPSWQEVDRVMSALGIEVRGDGHYVRRDQNQLVQYAIMPADQGFFLSLLLDVPRVTHPSQAFMRMVQDAQTLAQAFEATIVDDRGRFLSEADISVIHEQVAVREQALYEVGLEAGSPLSLRIFS